MLTRAVPLVLVAPLAFIAGVIVADQPDSPAAQRFIDAWEEEDLKAMHAELTPEAQEEFPLEPFTRAYEDAAASATIAEISAGEVREDGDDAVVAVDLRTNVFGDLGGELTLPIVDDKVAWAPNLVYPGLNAGERLSRRTRAPQRAAILAADRTPLSEGPAAARVVGSAALAVVGEVGTPSRAQERELALHGFPPGTLTGTSGLELAFNERLSGRPGGQLVAVGVDDENELDGGRVLATSAPVRGKAVRTNIDPELQEGAVAALGSLYGGAAVLDARTGGVLALAGLAYSAPQPPGSTFKIVTATGALDAGVVKLSDEFPVESSNSDIGREIPNAHDEPCGGTFARDLRRLVQHGLRPARGRARRRAPGGDLRALRLQLAAGAVRRGDDGDRRPAREHDPEDPLGERRDRRVGDRAGPGAGDAVADGNRLADGRQPRRPADDPDRPRARARADGRARSR